MAAPKGNQYAKGLTTSGRPEKYTDEWLAQEAKELLAWIEVDSDKKIYLGSFAKDRGYDRQRLTEFANKSLEFSDAYKKAKQWQEEKFIRNGLTRLWDPGFTSKCMARVCGDEWKNSWDREEEKQTTPTTVIINKIEK